MGKRRVILTDWTNSFNLHHVGVGNDWDNFGMGGIPHSEIPICFFSFIYFVLRTAGSVQKVAAPLAEEGNVVGWLLRMPRAAQHECLLDGFILSVMINIDSIRRS